MMEQTQQVARIVGGRYALLSLIGRGGHGEVWCARDHLTDDLVAVKLMAPSGCPVGPQARREIAALRAVQLPGVVRFLDEGMEGDEAFLVLELVRGRAFPGRRVPARWADIADTTRSLLEILAGVHAAGVVHQDLTPANILVDAGHPTLLDFGVAWSGFDDEARRGARSGTPAYMAPEQVRGEAISSAADVFALGLLLFESLSGRLPFPSDDPEELMAARCERDAPRLDTLVDEVPEAVVALVASMLDRDPARRPRDAREVLARLEGRPSNIEQLTARDGPPLTMEELVAMIVGPERIFHVPADAAALLMARTGGDRARVREEITAWVRLGLARRDGASVVLTRAAIDRLAQPRSTVSVPEGGADPLAVARAHAEAARALAPGTPERLGHLVFALPAGPSHAVSEVLREGVVLAGRALDEGRPGRGIAALAEAWLTVRRVGEYVDPTLLREAFAAWAELALSDGTPGAIDRALHELTLAQDFGAFRDLADLLQSALLIDSSPDRAFAQASALAPIPEPALERWRHAVRTRAARHGPLARERALVESLRSWADASVDRCDRAAFAGWEAWTLYRSGCYVEAADRHLAAAALEPQPSARLASRLAAASALLEGWQPGRALALAERANVDAVAARLPYLEARAAWIVRAANYRLERPLTPDPSLAAAVDTAGGASLHAVVALNEAAIAWRVGERTVGRELAGDAQRRWARAGRRWAPDMARALALACGERAQPGEVELLTQEALVCPVPAAGLQVLALIALSDHRAVPVAEAELTRLAALVSREFWSMRAAVLSTDEALAILRR